MNMKFRNYMWVGGIILGIFMVSNVYAWPGGNRDFKKMESRFQRTCKELNLTSEQEDLLRNHKSASRDEMKAFHEKMSDKMKELGDEIQKQDMDMTKINRINAELKAMHSEMQDKRLKDILEVREILTPEQFAKFREFREKQRPGIKGHHMSKKRMKKGCGEPEEK
jgi:Spy/CpxP family protein refolding chaperone